MTGGILAGGEGLRMGGVDKGLVLFKGQPLVRHVLAALAPQAGECLISANRHIEAYESFGVRVLRDAAGQGPLAGLAALLAAARSDWLLCVPCDAPYLPPDLGAMLHHAASAAPAPAAFLHDGVQAHPTFCLVQTRLARVAATGALCGQGLHGWLCEQGAVPVRAGAPPNINTLDELAAHERASSPSPSAASPQRHAR